MSRRETALVTGVSEGIGYVALTSLTHRFATDMAQLGRGYILNVASTAAWTALPGQSVYAASKAYVL